MGPGISAWPLIATERTGLGAVVADPTAYNWRREVGIFSVFRLVPARSLCLFGEESIMLGLKLKNCELPLSKQYEIVSATNPPALLRLLKPSLKIAWEEVVPKISGRFP